MRHGDRGKCKGKGKGKGKETLPDACEGTAAHLGGSTIQECTRGLSHACARGDDVIG